MENEIWTTKCQQSVPTGLERTGDNLNNGNWEQENIEGKRLENAAEIKDSFIKSEPGQEQHPAITISEKAKKTIEIILEQIKTLSHVEKFLLFLKLPAEITNAIDPFRQPLNPLGNRSEIYRTISWIRTHLEEDQDISLPKQEVYNEYFNYCETNSFKPLSQADFGKVMKQVYPRVRARRLGTRGNSRYCYSGLRRSTRLKPPILPDLADKPMSTEAPFTQSNLNSAAWLIVKNWSEKQLGKEFPSIQSLAYHLILYHSVSTGSEAATKIMCAAELAVKEEKIGNKHREMQIQLQRKLQQKGEGKERKRKTQSPKSEQHPNGKKFRSQSLPAPAAVPTTLPTTALLATANGGLVSSGECSTASSSSTSPTQGRTICDKATEFTQLPALPDFKSFQKPADGLLPTSSGQESNAGTSRPINKVPISRLPSALQLAVGSQKMPSKKPVSTPAKYKSLQQPALRRHCDIAPYNPQPALMVEKNRSQDFNNVVENRIKEKHSDEDDCDADVVLTRERINSVSNVDKDAMDEYLGTNNSQHEEELSKYFSNNNVTESENTVSKLSTLRQLLEQNGIVEHKPVVKNIPECKAMPENVSIPIQNASLNPTPVQNKTTYITPNVKQDNPINVPVSFKRRVSFETPIAEEPVPPSPNTRRKNFSFTPISPGPHSPNNGIQSKCSSTTASPFVSPRSTPILKIKTTHPVTGILKNEPRKILKVKKEIDLTIDIPQEGQFVGPNFSTAMSAPASPMLKKLLNSNSKVTYSPGYNVQSITPDVSQEVQFFSSEAQADIDSYRSHSAPVQQMVAVKPNFTIDSNVFIPEETTPSTDFSDIDPIPETESDNMKQILHSLNEQGCDNNNIDLFSISMNANNSCLDEFGLQLINAIDINQFPHNNEDFNPGRMMRAQSIDVVTNYQSKCNPSRSVPCTPVPFTPTMKLPPKINYSSSRSYPSTPLNTDEPFSYNINDCLLNGQPIRSDNPAEALEFMPNFGINGDNVDRLQPDKEFSVEGQDFSIIENDVALVENCVLQGYGGNIN